jgi:hypothetical protein
MYHSTTFDEKAATAAEAIMRSPCAPHTAYPVIAPVDAEDTSRAYFASTPVR